MHGHLIPQNIKILGTPGPDPVAAILQGASRLFYPAMHGMASSVWQLFHSPIGYGIADPEEG